MTLYLLPNLLAQDSEEKLSSSVAEAVASLDGLIAESATGGRRFLKRFKTKVPPEQVPIALLREDTNFLLEPVIKGESWGVVSDAGLPCLADPGAQLVQRARREKLQVRAFAGPCSITQALMLSGLPAQSFCFHGYIPKEPQQRELALRKWEREKMTHLFIEAPYRNMHTLKSCLSVLSSDTLLGIASNLTSPEEFVATHAIGTWQKKKLPELSKKPTIFLLCP